MLVVDQKLRPAITKENSAELIRKIFVENGGESLLHCALKLAENEETSLEEAARVAFFD